MILSLRPALSAFFLLNGALLAAGALARPTYGDELRPKASAGFHQKVTGDDPEEDSRYWETLFNPRDYLFGREPAPFLRENVLLLPKGRTLDLAMGEGRNAVFLARKGFTVEGVDISENAVRKAQHLAREHHAPIETTVTSLRGYRIPAGRYDVILNIDYLQRDLIAQIKGGLKRGGVVVFEAPLLAEAAPAAPAKEGAGDKATPERGLRPGELRESFADFQVLVYRETPDGGGGGGGAKGGRASLIAKKP